MATEDIGRPIFGISRRPVRKPLSLLRKVILATVALAILGGICGSVLLKKQAEFEDSFARSWSSLGR